MSAAECFVLHVGCGCGNAGRVEFTGETRHEAHAAAAREGWQVNAPGERDLCPRCVRRAIQDEMENFIFDTADAAIAKATGSAA